MLRAGDVHGESGAGDRDALPRAAHESPRADAADAQEGREGVFGGNLRALQGVIARTALLVLLRVHGRCQCAFTCGEHVLEREIGILHAPRAVLLVVHCSMRYTPKYRNLWFCFVVMVGPSPLRPR